MDTRTNMISRGRSNAIRFTRWNQPPIGFGTSRRNDVPAEWHSHNADGGGPNCNSKNVMNVKATFPVVVLLVTIVTSFAQAVSTVQFGSNSYSVVENSGSATITV